MFINGLGTAVPCRRYTQQECWDVLIQSSPYQELTPRSRAICRKILTGNNGIVSRHLALNDLSEAFDLTPDALHKRFLDNAPVLAAQAATAALKEAGVAAAQIDAIIISTCTGYLCPGLTSYVSERLGLRPDVFGLDLVGQGCVAAFPNFRAAHSLLSTDHYQQVLSICVEICSAAMFFDNDPGVLISACLFGDGAGAAVLNRSPTRNCRLQWKASGSLLAPQLRDLLRFEQKNGMLRNILSPEVPSVAARNARTVFEEVMIREKVSRSDVRGWVLHPGGRDILVALRERLGLAPDDLRWSEAVLREFGNLSSASLYFVLQTALADSPPKGYWWMSSFGAGFSCQGALLESA